MASWLVSVSLRFILSCCGSSFLLISNLQTKDEFMGSSSKRSRPRGVAAAVFTCYFREKQKHIICCCCSLNRMGASKVETHNESTAAGGHLCHTHVFPFRSSEKASKRFPRQVKSSNPSFDWMPWHPQHLFFFPRTPRHKRVGGKPKTWAVCAACACACARTSCPWRQIVVFDAKRDVRSVKSVPAT